MEQGGSGRPVLVLVAPFPEGLESPTEPEKPIFQYTRIPCYIISSCARSRVHKLRRRNGCRLDPVRQHLFQKGNKRTIGYGCKAGVR